MNEIDIYDSLLGFFLTMIITIIKSYLLKKSSTFELFFVNAIALALHFTIRKILIKKYSKINKK